MKPFDDPTAPRGPGRPGAFERSDQPHHNTSNPAFPSPTPRTQPPPARPACNWACETSTCLPRTALGTWNPRPGGQHTAPISLQDPIIVPLGRVDAEQSGSVRAPVGARSRSESQRTHPGVCASNGHRATVCLQMTTGTNHELLSGADVATARHRRRNDACIVREHPDPCHGPRRPGCSQRQRLS